MRQTDTFDERPGVAERYSTAIEASNLRAEADKGGAVDLLIAAGWSGDSMGAGLYRLRAEYDSVARNVRGTGGNSKIDHVLVLLGLTSLGSVKQSLGELALQQANLARFDLTEGVVRILAGKCLDVFLDPTCHPCGGRGFNGGGRHEMAGPQVWCKHCHKTGRRRDDDLGRTPAENRFVHHLLYLMERCTSNAEQGMRARLQSRSE